MTGAAPDVPFCVPQAGAPVSVLGARSVLELKREEDPVSRYASGRVLGEVAE